MADAGSVTPALAVLGPNEWTVSGQSGPFGGAASLTPAAAAAAQAAFEADGSTTLNATAAASTNSASLQAVLATGGSMTLRRPGDIYINETLLIPSRTQLRLAAGANLRLAGTYGRTMLRNGNACTSGNLLIGACFVICADSETPSGTGTIRSIAAPARLFYTAPGDVEGAAVDVSGADQKYTLTSANGRQLYVSLARAFLNAGVSQSVKVVSACDGARVATWTRTTTTLTITETGHSRRAGDRLTVFGTSLSGLFRVLSVSGNTWTAADNRGAGSGSCRVYGSRDIEVSVDNGAIIDYARAGKTLLQSCDLHAVIFNSISSIQTPGFRVKEVTKYAFYATCVSGLRTFNFETLDTNSDGWHINGPANDCRIDGLIGCNQDNMAAFGNSDFAPFVINWNAEFGSGDVEDCSVENLKSENSHTDMLRLYSSGGKVFRNIIARGFTGTVDPTTPAVISIQTDTVTPVDGAAELNLDGLLIENISVRRSDGGEVRVFSDTSPAAATAGVRRNITMRDITLPDPMGDIANPIVTNRGIVGAIQLSGNYDNFILDGIRPRLTLTGGEAKWKGVVLDLAAGCVMRKATVQNVYFANDNTLLPSNNFSSIVKIEPSATVTDLTVKDCGTSEVNGTGTRTATVHQSGGTVGNINVHDVRNDNGDSFVRVGAGTCASVSVDKLTSNGGNIFAVTQGINIGSILIGSLVGQCNSVLNNSATAGTTKLRSAGLITASIVSGSGMFTGSYAAGFTLDANGTDLVINLDNASLSRAANVGNLLKARALIGTIPAGVLAVNDASGVANSWKAVHNMALVY